MKIHTIPSRLSDNFFYLISADDGDDGLLVDPADAESAMALVANAGVNLRYVVNTHGHPDHTQGNQAIRDQCDVQLLAHQEDASWIGSIDRSLQDGEKIKIGEEHLVVSHAPGHTPGHVVLYAPGHLFCGDVLFVCGVGNCRFGGDPVTLYQTFRDVITHLPDETAIYPGHDYAATNLEFLLSLEGENSAAISKLEQAKSSLDLTPSTLGEERCFNPFLRLNDSSLLETLQTKHPELLSAAPDEEAVFVALRTLRNQW